MSHTAYSFYSEGSTVLRMLSTVRCPNRAYEMSGCLTGTNTLGQSDCRI